MTDSLDPVSAARFDLVIFDCDGVLIDSEVISSRMLIAALAGYGVTIDGAYVARHFLGRSYPVVLTRIRDEFGIDLPPGFEAEYRARLLEAFRSELRIIPGVRATLDALALPFCLATSSSPGRLAHSLEIVGLTADFHGRSTTAAEVAQGKPAPDLFLAAARKAGADPARCLVIEDSQAGIRAARAAGMEVWHFIGGSHLRGLDLPPDPQVRPHRRFARFAEIFQIAPELRRSDRHSLQQRNVAT
ncbi:HAD family hydrolase [Pseudooceanicola aestuarii]|uniref:HAD family hydrolase n=1 Tax=Pseudooceanicola aestuarii TaxID=2697319 RepID=UPI0013D1851E|nr:HAD family hydrolase [Pseudooceanicola aestuarii]